MTDSIVEKREYTFLWKIIGAYLGVILLNVLCNLYIKENPLYISIGVSAGLGLVLTILYAVSLKPKLNQFILFIVCIAINFWAVVAMTYDLPFKKVLAGVSVPLFLTLCGMWIYVKFSKVEVK